MHIVQIATELAPIAKAGGLADVVYGLSKELIRNRHHVEIILPKYDCLQLQNLTLEISKKKISKELFFSSYSAQFDGLNLILIDLHHPKDFFNRGMIYGCPDDIDRFTAFSLAALEFLTLSKKAPDLIHVHDWPTSLIPILYQQIYKPKGYRVNGIVLTVHNMEYQGKCHPHHLAPFHLPSLDKLHDPLKPTDLNLLKGGIEYADQVTTVSPTYEIEAQHSPAGFGLQETLKRLKHKFHGILNGIDEHFWDPQKDPYLFKMYDTHTIKTAAHLRAVQSAKKENRRSLYKHLQLREEKGPLVACISRLVTQKSPELIKHSLLRTLEKKGQFILLGTTPDRSIEKEFTLLQESYLNHGSVAILMDKDEGLAHQIFAAADLFIIPSLFEPCGLTQLIALRYGTIPIARMTGGLKDTIFDIDTSTAPLEERNGFTFDFPDIQGVNWALDRAIDCFRTDREKWERIMMQGMRQDYSWKHSLPHYLAIYEKLNP
jgi:starch synthase